MVDKKIQLDKTWKRNFREHSMEISDIAHDDDVWYFREESTCVCYGEEDKKCENSECFCAGGKYFGTHEEQILSIKEAIKTGGRHPSCPLF